MSMLVELQQLQTSLLGKTARKWNPTEEMRKWAPKGLDGWPADGVIVAVYLVEGSGSPKLMLLLRHGGWHPGGKEWKNRLVSVEAAWYTVEE